MRTGWMGDDQIPLDVVPDKPTIGIEDIADITADLDNALAQTKAPKKEELVSA